MLFEKQVLDGIVTGANPVMNVDPSGEMFDLGSLSASLNIRSILTEMQLDFGSRIVGSDPNEDDSIVDISMVYALTIPYIGSVVKPFAKVAKRTKWGWLWRHEAPGHLGHTVASHIGKTDGFLLDRIRKGLTRASTFSDYRTAENAIRMGLRNERPMIKKWLKNTSKFKHEFDFEVNEIVGWGFMAGRQNKICSTNIHVVLFRSKQGGYFIRTAFPNI